MKFGKTFESLLTSEWRQQYINYNELKAMIAQAVDEAPDPADATSIEINNYYNEFEILFFHTCKVELTRVNNFFSHKEAEAQRKLATLKYELTIGRSHGQPGPRGSKVVMDGAHISRAKRRKLPLAMSEFYLSLVMLQNYQALNHTAFRKICKKYDKNIKTSAANRWYENFVLQAPFVKTSVLVEMITTVEELYTEFLTNGDRAKAMARLRVPPLGQPTPPADVFFAAFFLGLFLVSALICILSFFVLNRTEEFRFMFFSLFRGPVAGMLFGFILVIDVHIWQKAGVNHVLIFEVERRKTLGSVKGLQIVSCLGYLCTLGILLYLFHDEFYIKDPYLIPLANTAIGFALLLNPIPVLFSSARFWLIRTFGRVIMAPFYEVKFVDFWMADQWNSLIICTVDLYYQLRFYFQYFRGSANAFDFEPDYGVAIIRCLPSWCRLAQCLRRYSDSKPFSIDHLLNAIKYVLSMTVVLFSTIHMNTNEKYEHMFQNPWTWAYLIMAVMSSTYSLSWDLLMDFGLFRIWKGENIFLRESLVYPKTFYYFAIVENVVLRFAWIMEFTLVNVGICKAYNGKSLLLFLEIFRRLIWNLLRLENEHLNNCGKFRATRDIFITSLHPKAERDLEKMMDESETAIRESSEKKFY
ncbi:solute carrier family 53 member 1 [Drosophila bipectinata]|uniref:solute carrier family 53 member 1 n=1 Tax=Drosophila bipectinata TaxID=42026 RepID=UPI001C8A1AED|nr:xenotropic and polytropic retrovirus receptor 1 homolog [Drosophila bipectinata]